MTPISVVLNTRNEEKNLPNALASVVPWASEVLVADMHSADATRELATAAGARVIMVEPAPYVEPARKIAVESAAHDWVFVLDADEMVPRALAQEIQARPEGDLFWIPRQNYLIGAAMAGAGWGPAQDRQLRLFDRRQIDFPGLIHQNFAARAGAREGTLQNAIIHFNYLGYGDFLRRLDRYTDVEARQLVAAGKVRSRAKVLRNAWRAFARRYWKQGGRADGDRGFYLSLLMAAYTLATEAKRSQLTSVGEEAAIREEYDRIAAKIAQEYVQN